MEVSDLSGAVGRRETLYCKFSVSCTHLCIQFLRVLVLLIAGVWSTGCVTQATSNVEHRDPSVESGHFIHIKVPFHEQQTKYGCGLAVLASLADYWGLSLKQDALLEKYPPSSIRDGYSISEISLIARKSGLHAYIIKGDIDLLKQQLIKGRPSIVPLVLDPDYYYGGAYAPLLAPARFVADLVEAKYSHYVIAVGFADGFVQVLDPVLGSREVNTPDFLSMWKPKQNAMVLISL